jgi:hypothetical protein
VKGELAVRIHGTTAVAKAIKEQIVQAIAEEGGFRRRHGERRLLAFAQLERVT